MLDIMVLGFWTDTTRRTMLVQLARGPLSVTELARPLSMSLPAVTLAFEMEP